LEFGKCENCGGNLKYDIDKESLFCEHCGQSQKSSKNIELEKSEMDKTKNKGDYIEDILFAKCQNCGAGIVYEDMELTFECPYCKTSNLLKIEDTNGLTPQGMVPFKINDQEAKEIFEKVVNKKMRKNSDEIIKTANIDKAYVPCFFFDIEINSKRSTAFFKKNKQKLIGYKEFSKKKENIPILANDRGIPKDITKVVEVKCEDIITFDEKYIAGYRAEKSTLSLLRAFGEAENELSEEIEIKDKELSLTPIIHDVIENSYEHNFEKGRWSYLLIPIYIVSYRNKEKYECFYINGCNGKFYTRRIKEKGTKIQEIRKTLMALARVIKSAISVVIGVALVGGGTILFFIFLILCLVIIFEVLKIYGSL